MQNYYVIKVTTTKGIYFAMQQEYPDPVAIKKYSESRVAVGTVSKAMQTVAADPNPPKVLIIWEKLGRAEATSKRNTLIVYERILDRDCILNTVFK